MHIPDGFLEPRVWVSLTVVAAGAVLAASKRVSKCLDEKMVPLMGVLAAFVFAAQMVNFPIGGGTSGHLMGGVLIASIVGPAAGIVIMASILIIQALLFQDGGITALGANIFNMGIVGALLGYSVFRGMKWLTGNFRISIFTASWFSVVAASCSVAAELSMSGVVPAALSFPGMMGTHAVIGIGEGAVTIAAIELISKVNKDSIVFSGAATLKPRSGKATWIWLCVSFLVTLLLAPFASDLPDGLEKVAERLGFIERGTSILSSPLSDYQVPGMEGGLSTATAGVVGILITFALAYTIVRLLHKRR